MTVYAVRIVSVDAALYPYAQPGNWVRWSVLFQGSVNKFVICGVTASLTEDMASLDDAVAHLNDGSFGIPGVVVEKVTFDLTQTAP